MVWNVDGAVFPRTLLFLIGSADDSVATLEGAIEQRYP